MEEICFWNTRAPILSAEEMEMLNENRRHYRHTCKKKAVVNVVYKEWIHEGHIDIEHTEDFRGVMEADNFCKNFVPKENANEH